MEKVSQERIPAGTSKELSALMEQADVTIQEGRDYLIRQGKVVDLSKWVTVKKYCEMFSIKNTETVSNWIRRGIVPADDTLVMEDFNDLRMIRAKEYRVGTAKTLA